MNEFEKEYIDSTKRVSQVYQEVKYLVRLIVSLSLEEINFETANKHCKLYINSGVDNFIYIGIVCAEHIARVYEKLVDREIIQKIIHIACGHTLRFYEKDAKNALSMMQSLVDYDIYSLCKTSTNYASQIEHQKKVFYEKGKTVNPISSFDLSVQVFPDRPRKYVADPINSRVIIFDEYLPGKFCHHFREYVELSNRPEFNKQLIWDTLPDEEEE